MKNCRRSPAAASRNRSHRSSVWPVRCEPKRGVRRTRNERDKSNRPVLREQTRRSDQTRRWLPTIRDAGTQPDEGRMATRLPDPQPAETLARRPSLIGPRPTTNTATSLAEAQSKPADVNYSDRLLERQPLCRVGMRRRCREFN